MKNSILFIFFILVSSSLFSGELRNDSIYKVISAINNPVDRVERLNAEVENMWRKGDYLKGLEYVTYTIRLAKEIKYKKGEADALCNQGIIFDFQGKYPEAIHLYFKALKIQSSIKDKAGISNTYNNLGLTYENQKKYSKALQCYENSLAISKQAGDIHATSIAINNIGIIYMHQKKYDLALKNYFYCIEVEKQLHDTIGIGDSYNNIALIYLNQNKYDKAEEYFLKSLDIRMMMNDKHGICNSYNNIGSLELDRKNYSKSKLYFLKSLEIGKKMGIKKSIQYAYENLSAIARSENNIPKELEYFKLFVAYSDSITNESNVIKQTQDEMQFMFDQKIAEEKLKDHKKDLIVAHEKHKQQVILWAVISLALVILIFSWFLYKRWRIEKNQKNIIEQQKLLVEEKNKQVESKNQEILASITYAKRIQSAILPPEKLVKEYLYNSFVLYKPKDIVAGDFYWIEPFEDLIIFAVADCTGHGVPGAMVSVVCHNALNRSVREFGLTVPGEILDKTREIIVSEFEKNDEQVYDGMDISLCSLDIKNKELRWAGANSPLWLIKKSDESIMEIAPNKQPIGKHISYDSFETQTVKIEEGDSIYLFTDGYADQFGGEDEKKFKSKKMRELIVEINHHPMHIQRSIFDETFEKWKGDFEQVDDVCVIGIKL